MGDIRDKVAVIGVGCAKFGENFEKGYEDMAVDAFTEALEDAHVERKDIEAAWLGTFSPQAGHGKAGTSLADALKLFDIPITRVENYCATGMEAFRNAAFGVASGMYDVALALGVEKMKDRPGRGLVLEGHHPLLGRGTTAPGLFALAANRYFHEFGIDKTTLAKVAVKNHRNGALSPKAHMQKEVTIEQVLKAPIIAWPFGLFDCCPTTDGSAAAILCRADLAPRFNKDYVLVKGIGLSVTSGRPYNDPTFDYVGFRATVGAAKQAYAQAGIKNPRKEIHLAEVHDCFTMTEILNYEDLGFAEKGKGWRLLDEGVVQLEGDLPVNPSGGLKSFGHPIGASGVRMIAEVTTQLRGKAGKRQVKRHDVGLAHNVGGPGAVSCVTVLANP